MAGKAAARSRRVGDGGSKYRCRWTKGQGSARVGHHTATARRVARVRARSGGDGARRAELLARAEQVDADEDAQHGKGRRGDELTGAPPVGGNIA